MQSNQLLRDRLVELNAQIALLEAERRLVQEKLQTVTYPILQLPFDLTSEIFVCCLPDLQHADPLFNLSYQLELPTALLLSQICRAWRDIAFNTPKIWSMFRIDIEAWLKDRSRRFDDWVQRARGSPLSFILEIPSPSAHAASPAILHPILALSNQWQNVDLQLRSMDLVSREFQSHLRRKLPSLQKLQIRTFKDISQAKTVATAFELAPSLRSVVLQHLQPSLILLPWQQLTHFTGKGLEGRECLHVVRLAVALVECKFDTIAIGRVDSTNWTCWMAGTPSTTKFCRLPIWFTTILVASVPAWRHLFSHTSNFLVPARPHHSRRIHSDCARDGRLGA
ncbi:hypothetical protein B0H12DRAFT_1223779 [Mycena haematopus]|nr:hypothetical protein B0H12DRAFT_1223779 [Mycena haematopus]